MLERHALALREAARRFGTPVYVADLATLRAAATAIRSAFPDPWLRAYSLKANDVAAVVAEVCGLGFDANVVSTGEWAIAHRAGVPNDRITFEGVGKSDADLRAAVRAAAAGRPLRWLAVESIEETRVVGGQVQAMRPPVPVEVLFRLNPDVAPETAAQLAVGSGRSKFGMTAAELIEAAQLAAGTSGLVPRGVHLHVGSQLRAVDAWRDSVRRALAVGALLRGSLARFDTLDLGGGFPVVAPPDAAPDPARFAREIPPLLEAIPADRRPARMAIEPGRALVARAGFLVGRVLHVRERGGRQVVLDVGMAELIRPALYGAHHPIEALTSLGRDHGAASARGDATMRAAGELAPVAAEPARVEGPICESTDSLGEHLLPPLRRGDLVAILDAGAYGASMASTYNGRPRPPQVLLEPDGRLRLVRRRGRIDQLG